MKIDGGVITGVNFSIWDSESIRRDSAVCITEKKTYDNGEIVENGLRDERLGATKGKVCRTCGEGTRNCNGHFGHIELESPVYHISWVNNVIYWLRCICFTEGCHTCIIKDLTTPRIMKNRHLQHYSKKVHTKCPNCEQRQPKYSWNREKARIEVNKVPYDIHKVIDHLERMDESILEQLDLSHPKDMILKVLPVPPPSVRPAIMQGSTVRGEDDLTYRLIQIMRANEKFKKSLDRPDHIINDCRESLQNAVSGYINHTKVGTSKRKASKREYTSLEPRLKSKEGRMRGNLMGKRCDFTARTVITGDDNLGMHQIGVPISVAEKLTIPEKVTAYNKKIYMEMLKETKKIKFVIRPNGSRVDLSFVNRQNISLDVGWTIERMLQDGDIVLFNRQPSLHKMSIMAHEVVVLPYSTFRMNLSCTTPYNADFDGDEMNIHVPQTVEARAEARNIMAVKYQIVSPQSNRPVMSVIQDTMVGSYLLSDDKVRIERDDMMECVMCMPGWDGIFHPKDEYTGKDLISYTLPMVNWSKGDVRIERGVMLSGRLTKKVLGRSDGSLVHVIYNDCGPDETILFINRLQKVVHKYLSIRGFSVGIGDMMSSVSVEDEIKSAFSDISEGSTENEINQRLNICRDTMGTKVQKPLDDSNRLYTMVHCGSKGSGINISQIMACVGQQNLCGERIPKTWTDRTLPHFKKGSNGPVERGFITNSYVKGLTPSQVYFHGIAGREGLIDTAIKTSQTGYIQRRFMKALENIIIHWDKTARNADGSIIQFQYGDDGFDPMRIENQHVDIWEKPTIEKYGHNAEEFDALLEDHEFIHSINKWRDNGSKDTSKFQLPIPIDRIINNARTLFSFPSRKISMEEAFDIVSELVDSIDNRMIKILIRCKLASKRVVSEYELTLDEIENIVFKIKDEYEKIRAIAGESVGAIAAQSIGEPATQMTLNTFHFAGVSSMNVTLGVPRLEELINCTKSERMKTPSTIIHTDDPDKLIKEIRHVTIQDLVDKIKITKEPNKEEVEWFHMFPDMDYVPHVDERETLVLYLKEWYDILAIKDCMDIEKISCAYSDGPKSIFHIQLKNDNDIGMYYEQILRKKTVRGIPGGEMTIKVKPPGATKYHVETSLSNLKEIMKLKDIDFSSIDSNDIHAIKRTYGIEAARGALIKEIRKILAYYGIYVNVRHITLAVDWMTWIGELTPLTRHGIRKVDHSPLKRATFEEVVDVFNQAACSKENDLLQGISECIITGAPPKLGTNVVGTVIDKECIRKHKIPYPVEKSIFVDQENEPWIVAPEEENPFVGGGFNANPFGMMGGMMPVSSMQTPMMPMMPMQPMMQPMMSMQPMIPMMPMPQQFTPVLPGSQMVALPSMQNSAHVRPPSPAYDPFRPDSPQWSPTDPQNRPPSPLAPTYSRPTSPAYDPDRPASPAYDPFRPDSPIAPSYDEKSYDPSKILQPESKRRRVYF